jgi:hypothetical protein
MLLIAQGHPNILNKIEQPEKKLAEGLEPWLILFRDDHAVF